MSFSYERQSLEMSASSRPGKPIPNRRSDIPVVGPPRDVAIEKGTSNEDAAEYQLELKETYALASQLSHALNSEIKKLHTASADLEASLAGLEQKYQSLHKPAGEIGHLKSGLSDLRTDSVAFGEQIKKFSVENESIRRSLGGLLKLAGTVHEQTSAARAHQEKLLAAVSEKEQALKAVEAAMHTQFAEISRTEGAIRSGYEWVRAQCATIQKNFDSDRAKAVELMNSLHALTAQHEARLQELQRTSETRSRQLEAERNELAYTLKGTREKAGKLQAELDAVSARLKNQEKAVGHREQQLRAAAGELARRDARIAEDSARIQKLEAAVAAATDEIKRKDARIAPLLQELSQTGELRKKLWGQEQTLWAQNQAFQEQTGRITCLDSEVEKLRKLCHLERLLGAKRVEKEKLHAEHVALPESDPACAKLEGVIREFEKQEDGIVNMIEKLRAELQNK